MCQLLGMNANTPTDICFDFAGFRRRGAQIDDHKDGFGLAFFERDKSKDTKTEKYSLRTFHDYQPSVSSPLANFLEKTPIHAQNMICHIRQASDGSERLINNHPFVRELWGESWVFAHNGQMANPFLTLLKPLKKSEILYQPIGDTDSEQAFCYLMNRVRAKFAKKPSQKRLFKLLAGLCDELSKVGIFNLLLSNGEWQLVYANTLMFYVKHSRKSGKATLVDMKKTVNFAKTMKTRQKSIVFATSPLTNNENWQQLAVGECLICQNGKIVHQVTPKKPVYLSVEDGVELAKRACDTL